MLYKSETIKGTIYHGVSSNPAVSLINPAAAFTIFRYTGYDTVKVGRQNCKGRKLYMETINTIELADESVYPDNNVLKRVLNSSYPAYCELLELFLQNGLSHGWRYYKDGKAWLCKVSKGKRTIVWMSAWKGYMQATVYFPEKYLERLFLLDVAPETVARFRSVKKVGRSTPCIFAVRETADLRDFGLVMKLKIECP